MVSALPVLTRNPVVVAWTSGSVAILMWTSLPVIPARASFPWTSLTIVSVRTSLTIVPTWTPFTDISAGASTTLVLVRTRPMIRVGTVTAMPVRTPLTMSNNGGMCFGPGNLRMLSPVYIEREIRLTYVKK